MTKDEAIKKLKGFQGVGDECNDHIGADQVLCDLLISLGYKDVVDEFEKVNKWYE